MISCYFEDKGKASLRHVTVNTIVIKDNTILLVKRSEKLSLEPGKWTLPGGFMGRDENASKAAERETLEESGYHVTNLQLLHINTNPNRPNEDRQNVDLVFFGQAGEQTGKPDWEVSSIKWFDLNNLPEEIAFDHRENIRLYLEHKEKGLPLPILS